MTLCCSEACISISLSLYIHCIVMAACIHAPSKFANFFDFQKLNSTGTIR